VHPQGGEKWGVIYREKLKVPRQRKSHVLLGGADLESVLACVLRATSKKRWSTFSRKIKCTPHPRENPGFAHGDCSDCRDT